MTDHTADSLPLLLEDGSRMDWTEAAYETNVNVGAGQATVIHRLSKAPALERLIDSGDAAWGVDVRCPKTLMAKTETSPNASQVVKWDFNDVDGDIFVVPGLVATKDLSLHATGLSSVYEGVGELRVPCGYWLAKGDTWRANALLESLFTFRHADDLERGRMAVAPDHGSGHFRFVVNMASDVYEHRDDRPVRIAALVGACAHFRREFQCDDEEDELPLARMLRDRLEGMRPGISLWDDLESYDPALVATLLEPFRWRAALGGEDGE